MKNRFYPLKWARATEAAWDLRCSVEIKGTTARWNRPACLSAWLGWHCRVFWVEPRQCAGWLCWRKCSDNGASRFIFSRGPGVYCLFLFILFDSTKSKPNIRRHQTTPFIAQEKRWKILVTDSLNAVIFNAPKWDRPFCTWEVSH